MRNSVLFNRVRTAAGRFAKADQGNIAVLFAIATVPILSFVGAAIDYTRANSARSSMQAALDSTALMVAKDLSDGTITASQTNTKAQAYFTALYNNNDARAVTVSATYTASTSQGSTILVNGSGNVPTQFMKIAGFPQIGFDTSSTSVWGNTRMRIALALDVTGSMANDGKMTALKPAAKALIDQLAALAKNTGDVYISVIPFAKDVNVGASNYTQSWINWSEWDGANGTCSNTYYSTQSSCQSAGKTWTAKNHSNWNGCVTDRDQDYDTKNTTPTSDAPNSTPSSTTPARHSWRR